MHGLERTSPCRAISPGRLRHAPREQLARHPHARAFATLVLAGGYVEAGDTGRHWMVPGDVLLHQAWESHLDRFGDRGAEVLVLAINDEDASRPAGRVADPDAIVRLAERDAVAAGGALLAQLQAKVAAGDWPDELAETLGRDPDVCIGAWASARGLRLGSVSRGFRQVYGVAPLSYRLVQRTRRALQALQSASEPLSGIALDCGFADQAHMSRAVRNLTGATPSALRQSLKPASAPVPRTCRPHASLPAA
jgi:AraC-like DNA-binding protein